MRNSYIDPYGFKMMITFELKVGIVVYRGLEETWIHRNWFTEYNTISFRSTHIRIDNE